MKSIIFKTVAVSFGIFSCAEAGPKWSLNRVPAIHTSADDPTVNNNAVLTGRTNSTVTPVTLNTTGVEIYTHNIKPKVIQVTINTTTNFVGAQFTVPKDDLYFGVWEYPFSGKIENTNVNYDLKGIGNAVGINWCNARAPFFLTTAGYGVYIDTLKMGNFDFNTPGVAQFVFNSSSLTYYIILPSQKGDFKSIIQEYTGLSTRIGIPPDSAYGPNFWSDNIETDFHGNVNSAEENYYDIVNHLYTEKIRATSGFADRPYGTGNWSFGNFDFDSKFFPSPSTFITNLSAAGLDFQVWIANRAFLNTQLYNDSVASDWLFPGIDPEQFLGPALNLSIPAAYDYFKSSLQVFPDLGAKGFKIDRGEEGEMPDYEQNIQMSLFTKLAHEVMSASFGEGKFYNFARSVVDRSRALTGVWNGDSESSFTGLQYSVASGIRAGILGFSQWGSDTGGYTRDADSPSQELWARWMWFSAFSPVYEIMVGTGHTPWYPPYTSQLVSILKSTTDVHMALLPYIRSYTYVAAQTGIPVLRALFLDFPSEIKTVAKIADQYLLGAQFLVAPIVTPGTTRSVYFPGPGKWLNYFSRNNASAIEVYSGGTTAVVSAPLEEIPVYVREGAIIPTGDLVQGNKKWEQWAPYLNFEIYPSFDAPEATLEYWSRETNVSVVFKTSVTRGGKDSEGIVTITSGTFGNVNSVGRFWVYGKAGVERVAIPAKGGITTVVFGESIWG